MNATYFRTHHVVRPAVATVALLALGPLFGVMLAVSAKNAGIIRSIVAASILGVLAPITLRWPRAGVVATIAFLTSVGLVRRILIPVAGWSQTDPLLLVGPAVAVLVISRRPHGEEPRSVGGRLPALVMALLCVTALEIFNPDGGGVVAGVTGLLFVAAPLLWFFVGAWLADDGLVIALQMAVVIGSSLAAAYGLWQYIAGFPSWDAEWIRVGGYTALQVGVVRSFSSFVSSAEYAIFLGVGIVIIVAQAMRGRLLALPALPLLIWAVILESSRTVVVQGLAGILIMAAMLSGNVRRAVVVIVVGLAVVAALDQFLGPHLLAIAGTTSDPLIAHQLGGLGDPLNPEESTAQIHIEQVVNGFQVALNHPLGVGTAATNLAGARLTDLALGAEVDIPNQFISLGFLGGALYLAIVVLTLAGAAGQALRRRDVASIATVGILVVAFGQWLNGAYYALAPLIWLLIGSLSRSLWLASRPVSAGRQLDEPS